jgi:hypothetical protein
MEKVFVQFIGEDEWSRRTFRDVQTGRLIKEVDGLPHSVTEEGEPIEPLTDEFYEIKPVKFKT